MKKILILILLDLFFHSSGYSQWTVLNSGTASNLRTVVFLNTSTGFAGGAGGILLRTTNSGVNWNSVTSGLSSDINSISFYNSSTGLACANGGNIIMSTNAGSSWNPVTSGTPDNLYAISFFDNLSGVCSGSNGTLMYTTNGGLNWIIAVNGFLSNYYGAVMSSSSSAFACGVNTIFQPLIAKTTNGGANWSYSTFYLNGNEGNLRDIYFISSTEGFAVSNVWDGQGGISYSSNSGTNWTTQLVTSALNGMDFAGQNTGYAVGLNGFITRTTNKGISWETQLSGTSSILRSVDFIDSLNGYAVGDGGVIIKTTNGGITSLEPVSGEVPSEYSLLQNYPNPFNPETKIKFSMPGSGFTLLKIYDALGREISTLVNEELNPGTYEAGWNASKNTSGIYFYKLTSGDFTETKKMILIK
jgi:photosystem II stability/assembly factor-like uncharacterized protein